MKKYILLFVFALLVYNKGKAQAELGISRYSYAIGQDTVAPGTTDSILIWVVNRSEINFNDTLHVYTGLLDSGMLFSRLVDSVNRGYVSIPAHDSLRMDLSPVYNVSPSQYVYDINVIVIWPAAISAATADSLQFIEYIISPDGVSEIDLNQFIRTYPNPVVDNFTIENTSKLVVEEVRIMDSSGRLTEILKNQTKIETKNWEPGIYVVDIVLKNKQHTTVRIIKQK